MVFTGADVARMKTEGPTSASRCSSPCPARRCRRSQRRRLVSTLPGPAGRSAPADAHLHHPPAASRAGRGRCRFRHPRRDRSRLALGHACPPGDRVVLLAPDADCADSSEGWKWKPPAGVGQVLLVADETALPAVAGRGPGGHGDPPRTLACWKWQAGDAVPEGAGLRPSWSGCRAGRRRTGSLLQAVQARLAAASRGCRRCAGGDRRRYADLWEQADSRVAGRCTPGWQVRPGP
jgi:hypothetical protein